jgi:hypothetical protein
MDSKALCKSALAIALALAWSGARADTTPTVEELARQLAESLKTIQALQKRVTDLEAKVAAPPPVAQAASGAAAGPQDLSPRVDAVEHDVAQLQTASAVNAQHDRGVPIHGFADVKIGDENVAERQMPFRDYRGTSVGTLDLYLTPEISPRVKALFEIAMEYDNFSQALGMDVERGQLGYVFSDAATLWGGRFHTPYGYWNTAFHHGAQLQTSLTRPQFLDFEDSGGILPAHSVGVWLTGAERLSLGKAGYDFYLNNGDRVVGNELYFQPLRMDQGGLGSGFRLNFTPAGSALTVGMHGLQERVVGKAEDTSIPGNSFMRMLGGYAVYDDDTWTVLSEYYHFRNRDLEGATGTHSANAWYVQTSYNIDERWTPYARYERLAVDPTDPYFAMQIAGVSYRKAFLGVRYNLTPAAAIKLEAMHGQQAGTAGDPSALIIQYGIRF